MNVEEFKREIEDLQKEVDVLRRFYSAAGDYMFSVLNPDFAKFCGESVSEMRKPVVEASEEYQDVLDEIGR